MTITNTKPFIAGNWKMNGTIPEAKDLVQSLLTTFSGSQPAAEIVLIPPLTAIHVLKNMSEGSPIKLGAQNVFWEEKGAYTGEVSASMLKNAGCDFVVVGHSERRQYFGETNETVNKKLRAALGHGLIPIMCIGETLKEREENKTTETIDKQIVEGLNDIGLEDLKNIVLAYEPVWAIGTGLTATPEQAEEVHLFIRNRLAEMYGNEASSCAIILYGGSVKPENTFSLLREKDINGALVGGASLKADSFAGIIEEGIRAYKEK